MRQRSEGFDHTILVMRPVNSMPMTDIDNSSQSPCVRNCCLDDDLICVGCFRTLDEIKEWGIVGDSRRDAIRQAAEQRRLARCVSYMTR